MVKLCVNKVSVPYHSKRRRQNYGNKTNQCKTKLRKAISIKTPISFNLDNTVSGRAWIEKKNQQKKKTLPVSGRRHFS